MKSRLLIMFAIGIIGFTGIAFAEHDPNQPYTHSIILPDDVKEKTFDEFMEWCESYYGDKCVELYANIHLIPEPEPPYFENIDKEKPCGLGTIYQNGICVVDETGISVDTSHRWEVAVPESIDDNQHVLPELLWNNHEAIIDGTIIDTDDEHWMYHIKVNKSFKGLASFDLISAEGFDVWTDFQKGDRVLFYLSDLNSPIYQYRVTDYSVNTTTNCDARSFIEMSPVLPNEKYPISSPTMSESYFDPCVADYFSYDPDFFGGIVNGISPLKQIKYGIPNDMIRCYDDLIQITKHDGSPACVKPITVDKLYERGWTDPLTTYFCFSKYLPVCGINDVTYGNLCFMEKSGVELKHDGECENVPFPEYQLDETEFLQIKNNMENVGYHICDIQLEENKILIVLNWIFEDSEPEKMILSQIPSNVNYEIKYLDEYSDYFISKESIFACEGLENEN